MLTRSVSVRLVILILLFLVTITGNAEGLNKNSTRSIDASVDTRGLVEKLLDAGLISTQIYERQLSVLSTDEDLRTQSDTNASNQAGDSIADSDGRYVALVLGSNDYTGFEPLETAVNDARAVGEVLRSKFGFEVNVVLNPTRKELISNLQSYRDSLRPEDHFLLYYAGHGILDESTNRGYWLPIDAEPSNPVNWVSNGIIADQIREYVADQVLVIADACFSGSLAAPGTSFEETSSETNAARARSRIVISSGGLEPVLDSGFGEHSIFAQSLLNELSKYDENSTLSTMFDRIRNSVVQYAEQEPRLSVMRYSGHEGGTFRFRRSST